MVPEGPSSQLGPYRGDAQDGSDHWRLVVARLERRIELLERAFEGIIPYQSKRGHCPLCGHDDSGHGWDSDLITNKLVHPSRGWFFKRSVPGHVLRTHHGCKGSWREMVGPEMMPVAGMEDWL